MKGIYTEGPTGISTGAIAAVAVLIALVLAGVVFNAATARLRKRGFPSSILVVLGVGFTLPGAWALQVATGWHMLVASVIAFVASGTPMIIGDLLRSADEAQAAQQHATQRAEAHAAEALRKAQEYLDDGPDALAP